MISTARTIALIRLLSGGTPAAKVQKATMENLAALLESSWLADNSVTSTAYAATVPSGSLPWATMTMLGGKTIVWNQLVDSDTSSVTLTSGHEYYTLISDTASIQTGAGSAISVTGGTDMVCDLTLMFGSGNEPSTVADFTAMFPADYYAYNSGSLKSAAVTQMVTADSNATQIGTYAIPAAIQALDGYGWSAGSVYNYVDYANKKYVQNVGRVNLGNWDWFYVGTSGQERFFTAPVTYVEPSASVSVTANAACALYASVSVNTYAGMTMSKCLCVSTLDSGGARIIIRDTSYTDAATFKTAMSGVYMYYELATPIETDISAYLTDADALINVEAGGTVTFENSLGDDYRIPMPSTVTYAENLIPNVPSSDGTYTLTATVSDGDVTYSWA